MSELQISLLAIGAVAVIAVFAFNRWQEHRAGRAADEAFKSRHPDVLVDPPGTDLPVSKPSVLEAPRIEPAMSRKTETLEPALKPLEAVSSVLDARIDYVIELSHEGSVAATSISEGWAGIEHRFPRRVILAGLVDVQSVSAGSGVAGDKLEAALQMVSRSGVVSESELLEFRSSVETLASKLHLAVGAPEMRDALEAARSLDGICAQADIQVAFHVVAELGAAFAGTKVRAAAEAAGFLLDAHGRFALCDEEGRELYELADRSGAKFALATMKDATPQALTLSMDVPRAPDTQRTFDAMVRFGKHLAQLLGGGLVDDNNHPLDERAIAAINAELLVVRRNLEAQGIAPGSGLALRLFS